jgi:hypothetical protein
MMMMMMIMIMIQSLTLPKYATYIYIFAGKGSSFTVKIPMFRQTLQNRPVSCPRRPTARESITPRQSIVQPVHTRLSVVCTYVYVYT